MIKILCLDGGGSKGISTLEMLYILQESGINVYDFDMIWGTSTGGIIGGIIVQKIDLQKAKDLYFKFSHNLFGNKLVDSVGRFARYMYNGNYYSSDYKESFLNEHIGNTLMNTSKKHLVFVSTNATYLTYKEFLFRSYDPCEINPSYGKNNYEGTNKATFKTALMASTAAPTYFGPSYYENIKCVDGGLIANNPSLMALIECKKLYPNEKLMIISLGTGRKPKEKEGNLSIDLLEQIIDDVTNSRRIHKEVSSLSKMLGINYFRFNPPKIGSYKLDESDFKAFEIMVDETKKYMKLPKQKEKIKQIKEIIKNA